MSEFKFDPMTGQPIKEQNSGYKFDPITGQPISQQPGGNQQSFGNQQTGFGAQQTNQFGYDPAAIEQEQSRKNKKLAVRVLAIAAVAIFILAVIGGVYFTKSVLKNAEHKRGNKVTAEVPSAEPAEEPADVREPEPVDDQVEEPVVEPSEDGTDELVLQEIPEPDPADFGLEEPSDEPSEEPADEPEQGGNETVSTTGPAISAETKAMFSLQVSDQHYNIPAKVSEFLDNGWTFDTQADANATIGSHDKEFTYMYFPGAERGSISMAVTNFSLDSQQMKDCYVTEISFTSYDVKNIGVIKVHDGDIVLGESSEDDVKAILGTPDDVIESSVTGGHNLYYMSELDDSLDSFVSLMIDENGLVDHIRVENEHEPEDFVQTTVSSDEPEYLSEYVAPSSLGSDPFSGNMQMDNVVYHLPAPFMEFVNNGWEYGGDLEYTAGADLEYVVQFTKNNRTLTATAYNPTDKATFLKYTVITEVHAEDSDYDAFIEFPGGLNPAMTETELLAFMTQNGITNYDYLKKTGTYTIPFDQTGKDRSAANNRYQIYTEDGSIYFMYMQNYGDLRR